MQRQTNAKFRLQVATSALALLLIATSFPLFGQSVSNQDLSVDSRMRSTAKVDPVSHALQFSISLGQYPGRGANLPVVLNYSSKVWALDHSTTNDRTPTNPEEGPFNFIFSGRYAQNSASGWTSTLDWVRFPTSASRERYDINGKPLSGNPYNGPQPQFAAARIYVQLPDGSRREMRRDDGTHQVTSSHCTIGAGDTCGIAIISYNPDLPGVYYSVDGSGMKYDTATQTLWLPDGSRYVFTGTYNSPQALTYYDRNGNVLNYNYGTNQWTDTLGRVLQPPLPNANQVGITYGASPRTDVYQLPGLGSALQTYTFRWKYLRDPNTTETVLSDPSQQLRPIGDRVSTQNCTLTTSLFASSTPCVLGLSGNNVNMISAGSEFNPVVLAEIELPNGSKYDFKYNIYGEIDKINYPTGAYERFEHGIVPSITDLSAPIEDTPPESVYPQANRGVVKHWISPNGIGTDEILTQYQGFTTTNADGTHTERVVQIGGNEIPFGFESALVGNVLEERFYSSTNQMVRRTLNSYIVEGPRGTGAHPAASRDARLGKQISITMEPGAPQALATMTETVYDSNADPAYFASLNTKQVKTYGYAVADLSTAQTGTIAQLSALFNSSHLVTVTEADYIYDANYKARSISGLTSETRVLNPTNTSDVLAKSQFIYDESAYFDNNYSTTNWVNPNSTLRGNVTTSRTWVKETDTWLESHTMYDNFGNVRKVWDTSGDTTRFVETEYSSTYKYAYPIKTKAPAPDPTGVHGMTEGSEISRDYDFNTGLMLSVTDANGQTATTEYDNLLRPIRINPPAGGSISETIYNDTPNNIWVKSRQQIDETNWAESTTFYDNLGRVVKTRTKDLQGDVMSQVKYDSFGRVEKTSNPYRVDTNGNPTETVYWSKPRYDELNRVVETFAPAPEGQTGASLGTVEFGISTLPNLVGTYAVATDASGRKSRAISGIYGLMRVDEATGKGGTVDQDLGTLENPTQPTSYSYNIKGELTKTTQGSQNRYFMYDSFGRLTRVRQSEQTPNSNLATTGNPENNQWTAAYSYDVFGNVLSVIDAKNTTITNHYDKAGRTIKRTYTEGTPEVEYFYDGKGLPQAPQFSRGALTKVTSSVSEDRFTGFDNHGRLLASQQVTDGQTYDFEYKYNLSGGLLEQTYPSGRIVRNFLDGDGGLNIVNTKAANGLLKQVASNFDYSATGSVRKMKLGNGLWETSQLNHLNQLIQIGLGTTQTNNSLFKVDYEYGELNVDGTTVDTGKNTGIIAKTTTTIPTTDFVQTFKYDAINRLTEAIEKTGATQNWIQTFGYDRFGNRTQFSQTVGSTQLQINNITHPTIDQANNRFTTGQGYVYDLNGNLIQDAEGRHFTFNGDDKQTEVRNAGGQIIGQYFYDGSGARVKKHVPSTGETTVFVYDAGGALAAEYSTIVEPPATAKTSYLTTDHLGSPRVITDEDGEVISRRDFMPCGEGLGVGAGPRTESLKYSLTNSDNIRQRFTGYEKDDETQLDFAQARMYQNKHGRFTAPDPLLGSANAANPQTFNRYTYTGNNPTNRTDPSGLIWCGQAGSGSGLGDIAWQDGNQCSNGWNALDLNSSYGCNRGPCTIRGTTYAQGTVFRFNADGTHRAALADPGQAAVSQGREVAGASGNIAGQTASAAANAGPPGGHLPNNAPQDGPLSLCLASSCPDASDHVVDLTQGASAEEVLHTVQAIADTVGLIPGLGEPADAVSGLISLSQGDYHGAGLSAAAMIPILGTGAGATKIGRHVANAADSVSDLTKTGRGRSGIYEFPDAKTPGTYVGQSGDMPKRIKEHERTGKKSPDSPAKMKVVPGEKVAREIAEDNRIQKLGGVKGTPGSKTSNIRNPIGKTRRKKLGLE